MLGVFWGDSTEGILAHEQNRSLQMLIFCLLKQPPQSTLCPEGSFPWIKAQHLKGCLLLSMFSSPLVSALVRAPLPSAAEGNVSGSGEGLLPSPADHCPHGTAKCCEDPLCTEALNWNSNTNWARSGRLKPEVSDQRAELDSRRIGNCCCCC